MSQYKELTRAEAREKRAAIDAVIGHPTKGVNLGAGPHVHVPEAFTPGAPGWTETECAEENSPTGDGKVLLTLTPRAVAIGRKDVVVDGKVVSLDLTKDVLPDKPAKYTKP